MGGKQKVIPDGPLPTVAFTVLAQSCGPLANETEMGAALLIKNGEGRTFALLTHSRVSVSLWVRERVDRAMRLCRLVFQGKVSIPVHYKDPPPPYASLPVVLVG